VQIDNYNSLSGSTNLLMNCILLGVKNILYIKNTGLCSTP